MRGERNGMHFSRSDGLFIEFGLCADLDVYKINDIDVQMRAGETGWEES